MVSTPSRLSDPSTAFRMRSGRLDDAPIFSCLEINVEAELGGDDDLVAERPQRFADDLLVGEGAIDLGRVEEGHAAVHRGADQGYALVLGEFRGVAEADPHAAETDGGNIEAAAAEFTRLHVDVPFDCAGSCGGGRKHFTGDPDGGAGGRPARVEGEVRDHLDDLVAGHAILERLSKMELELVAAIESDQAGDGDEAAVARAEPGRRHTSSNRTVSLISVRRGAMSAPGSAHRGPSVRHGLIPFRGDPHLAVAGLCV